MSDNLSPNTSNTPPNPRARRTRTINLILAVVLAGLFIYNLVVQKWLDAVLFACLGTAIFLAPPGGGIKGLRARISLGLLVAGLALFIYLFAQDFAR
jgi:hypothetical protein